MEKHHHSEMGLERLNELEQAMLGGDDVVDGDRNDFQEDHDTAKKNSQRDQSQFRHLVYL